MFFFLYFEYGYARARTYQSTLWYSLHEAFMFQGADEDDGDQQRAILNLFPTHKLEYDRTLNNL